WRRARALRDVGLDLAVDLQGDLRSALLMAFTGARRRVGYANTGGAYLLTDVVALDETVSWVEQNQAAVEVAVGAATPAPSVDPLLRGDPEAAARLFDRIGLSAAGRPLVGVHPSGGRAVKQWDPARWGEVAARLERDFGATIVVTGSEADRPLAEAVARGLRGKP